MAAKFIIKTNIFFEIGATILYRVFLTSQFTVTTLCGKSLIAFVKAGIPILLNHSLNRLCKWRCKELKQYYSNKIIIAFQRLSCFLRIAYSCRKRSSQGISGIKPKGSALALIKLRQLKRATQQQPHVYSTDRPTKTKNKITGT